MSEICGVEFPAYFENMALAVCVRNPKHRGDHSCHIRFAWPQSCVLVDGSTLFTTRYRERGKSKWIAAAIEVVDARRLVEKGEELR